MTETDATARTMTDARGGNIASVDWSNATLVTRTDSTDDLLVFRVRPDDDRFAFPATVASDFVRRVERPTRNPLLGHQTNERRAVPDQPGPVPPR